MQTDLSPDTIAAIQQTGLIIMLLPILLCCILLAFAVYQLAQAHLAERAAAQARKPNRYMQARAQAAMRYTARRSNLTIDHE